MLDVIVTLINPESLSNILVILIFLSSMAIGWFGKTLIERRNKAIEEKLRRLQEQEEKLRNDRIEVYNQILEPFVILLTKDEGIEGKFEGKDKRSVVQEIIISFDYIQAAFKLALVGSDKVVKSYNSLMQFFFHMECVNDPKQMLVLLGNFLLEIRKNVGNEQTTLDNLDMLEWLIRDIKNYR